MIFGTATAFLPLRRISPLLMIPQIITVLAFFYHSAKLFSTWKDKKIKYKILFAKNKDEFKPESFKIFMQAPCGRLLSKAVLKDLGIRSRYRELLTYKEPFWTSLKNGCGTVQTKIYINEAGI